MDHAKFWPRRHRPTTELTVCGLLVCALVAAPVVGQKALPEVEEVVTHDDQASEQPPAALSHFLETVGSFRARFVQELWSDDQRLIEVAEGDVELLRPGRFRWHYEEPYEQFVIADGETLWMYDVDISQVTRSPLDANSAGNPGALLTGDSSVMDSFAVVDSDSDAEETWIVLAPRAVQSDYSSVRVAFAGEEADGILQELEFVDGLNQTTVIRFLDAEVNPEIGPERFEFEVPADVHVLGGPG